MTMCIELFLETYMLKSSNLVRRPSICPPPPLLLSAATIFTACLLGACCPRPLIQPNAEAPPSAHADLVPPAANSRPELHTRVLPNGLKVYLLPDDSAPLVCVQFWVKAGSVDEHEATTADGHGITGLSHFFEHLIFQGTERYPDYDRTLNPVGGRNNAFTYNDATAYWSYAPREHLALLLDLEADRFEHMKVDFVHLEPEREVVKNERRLRVDADAAEVAEELATARTFDTFPYRWGAIGWMSDLDAVTLEEAQAYHTRHYRPDNTWLVISGSMDMQTIDDLLAKTWGRLPLAPPQAAEALPQPETWRGERRDHLTREHPNTTLFLSWRAPAMTDNGGVDFAALELIDWALTAGKSGRIGQALVYTPTPTATNVGASLMSLRYPYVWMWRVELAAGATTDAAITAIDSAIADITANGLTEDEIARAIASLRADMVSGNLSHKDRAESVGFALSSTGNPLFLFERLDILAAVTNADIRRVAAKFLTPDTRVRFTLVPPSRYGPLLAALQLLEPQSSGLADMAKRSLDVFIAGLDLKTQQAELTREERAVRLLGERGARALKGADAETSKEITEYLQKNEMGTTKRLARLEAQRLDHAKATKGLTQRVATLRRLQGDLAKRGRTDLRKSTTSSLISLLLQSPSSRLPTNTPPGMSPGTAIIFNTFAAFVADSRNERATGDRLRAEAVATVEALRATTDGTKALGIIEQSGLPALLTDTTRANLPASAVKTVTTANAQEAAQ